MSVLAQFFRAFTGGKAPSPDDAPTVTITWPCVHCGTGVPIVASLEQVAVVRLDHTDLEAHALTHEETR